MSSNGEVHGAKLQRENTALTAACLNEGSKTSISRSHEMKGKIVDVHPVALKLQKKREKKGKRKAVNTKESVKERERGRRADRGTDRHALRKEMRGQKRFKGQEHRR